MRLNFTIYFVSLLATVNSIESSEIIKRLDNSENGQLAAYERSLGKLSNLENTDGTIEFNILENATVKTSEDHLENVVSNPADGDEVWGNITHTNLFHMYVLIK